MPKLSLWNQNRNNDYRFLDRTIREKYTIGGLDIFVHKYIGPVVKQDGSGDATQPVYDAENPLFIEDLLLLENRNRNYDPDIHTIRGVYDVQNIDFDLSQFGLFLQNDTIFVTFHYNDMIDIFGRKLMNGDVLEIPNLKDYHPLDPNTPPLPKLYVINDASFAAEGFSMTWRPHLWRVKAVPLVGAQEYKNVLDQYYDSIGGIDGDDGTGNGYGTLNDYMCQHGKALEINEALVTQAEQDVPLSGYDIAKFYVLGYGEDGNPQADSTTTADIISLFADNDLVTTDRDIVYPVSDGYYVGYLTGDGSPPNDAKVTPGVAFPVNPEEGDFALRLDYSPNRLFRYNGSKWEFIEDNVRTDLTPGETNLTQRSKFVNNSDTVETADRGTIPSRQSLNDLLKPKADN